MGLRRLHVPLLHAGTIPLDESQSHHARHVLRLPDGAAIELFDDAGNTAAGRLIYSDDSGAAAIVEAVRPARAVGVRLTIASAVPKGERADWMVEKLGELDVIRWIPLAAERSVVLPSGAGKRQRWMRIATESAKQSRRIGVMSIEELTPLPAAIADIAAKGKPGWVLSTEGPALDMAQMVRSPMSAELTAFVGPEGGWAEAELRQFAEAGIPAVRLGRTILRIETAAIAVAAIVAAAAQG